jgi:hypothetical protein
MAFVNAHIHHHIFECLSILINYHDILLSFPTFTCGVSIHELHPPEIAVLCPQLESIYLSGGPAQLHLIHCFPHVKTLSISSSRSWPQSRIPNVTSPPVQLCYIRIAASNDIGGMMLDWLDQTPTRDAQTLTEASLSVGRSIGHVEPNNLIHHERMNQFFERYDSLRNLNLELALVYNIERTGELHPPRNQRPSSLTSGRQHVILSHPESNVSSSVSKPTATVQHKHLDSCGRANYPTSGILRFVLSASNSIVAEAFSGRGQSWVTASVSVSAGGFLPRWRRNSKKSSLRRRTYGRWKTVISWLGCWEKRARPRC